MVQLPNVKSIISDCNEYFTSKNNSSINLMRKLMDDYSENSKVFSKKEEEYIFMNAVGEIMTAFGNLNDKSDFKSIISDCEVAIDMIKSSKIQSKKEIEKELRELLIRLRSMYRLVNNIRDFKKEN
jgi:hypothetical protein